MQELFSNEYLAFFLIVALGLLLGNIKIKGISLDVSAIIFVALVFGHFGFKIPDLIQKIGLILFIYSVGIQAGPGFFSAFKQQGNKLMILALVVVLSGGLIAALMAWLLDLDFALVAGIFNGALTSTPGLAAAIEATNSPVASIGYGLAYPFGVIGVILFVRLTPKLFRLNIKKAEEDYMKEISSDFPEIINRNFIVKNPNVFGKTLGQLAIRSMTGASISRIMHQDKASTPNAGTIMHEGDFVKAVGTAESLEKFSLLVGAATEVQIPLSKNHAVRRVLVTNKEMVSKRLGDLGLFTRYQATATCIRRAGIDLTPFATTRLQFGDRIMIACPESNMLKLRELLGDSRQKLAELDFLPVAIGILIGVLIGQLEFPIPGLHFKLGLTGGVLVSALVLSKIGKTGSLLWNIGGSSNQLIRKIGLIFFLAAVGTNAGGTFLETIRQNGFLLFGVGALITIVPMILSLIVGLYILRINPLSLLGAMTGSMTSTPALSAIEPMTESDAPQIAYATVYPIALVLLILVSQLFGLLV